MIFGRLLKNKQVHFRLTVGNGSGSIHTNVKFKFFSKFLLSFLHLLRKLAPSEKTKKMEKKRIRK